MAALSLIGTVLGLVGTFVSASAAITQAEETKRASIAAENARRQQMQLDANRRRRQAVRESLVARATALSVGTNQGAGQGTGVAGAMAQATATGRQNVQTTNSAEVLGNRVFDANIAYAEAVAKGQKAMAFGSLISSIGGALTSSAGTLGSLGGQPQYG